MKKKPKKTKADRLELALAEALWLLAGVYQYIGTLNPRGKKAQAEQIEAMDALVALQHRHDKLLKAKTRDAACDTDAIRYWADKVKQDT